MPKQPAKKATKKTVAKKAVAKKAVASKAPAKKAVAKKVTASKAPVKKAAVKKVAAPKAPAETAAAKKAPAAKAEAPKLVTTVIAKIDAGFGNQLYLRGDGPGLSWDKGVLMTCDGVDEWTWSSDEVAGELEFKVLLNDETWAEGPNAMVIEGATIVFEPAF